MPDSNRRYFFYHNPQTDFFELGYLAEGLPGVVLYRSAALGSGAGRALLVWPLRAETPPPRLAIPAALIVRPPFAFCSAAEALEQFEASFGHLRWLGFEDRDGQGRWTGADVVAQFQRQVAADAQALANHAWQAAA